jgi:hypothetical protein
MSNIDALAKGAGMNRSKFVVNMVANHNANSMKLGEGGGIQLKAIPEDVEQLLVAGGAAAVGIGAYVLLTDYLEKQKDINGLPVYSDGEVKFAGVMLGVALAMLGLGVYKAISNGK